VDGLRFRVAGGHDAAAIAALHADSWRRHYRGALPDAFLDHEVFEDRQTVWAGRLRETDGKTHTVLAEQHGEVVGFAHTVFDADPTWGSLLDNLHVTHATQRRGVGSHLLKLTAAGVTERGTPLYLWVLQQNVNAQAFYQAHGAVCVERASVRGPGEGPTRLNASPAALRYAWADPSIITRQERDDGNG
jgi:GNAT superfamily N-acetyltransferase